MSYEFNQSVYVTRVVPSQVQILGPLKVGEQVLKAGNKEINTNEAVQVERARR